MHIEYSAENDSNQTAYDFPDHYLPAMPSDTLVDLGRRVFGGRNRDD